MKKLPIAFAVCVLAIATVVTWRAWCLKDADILQIGTFLVLALTPRVVRNRLIASKEEEVGWRDDHRIHSDEPEGATHNGTLLEFWDELDMRRKLPPRRHYFDFERWAWIPQLAECSDAQ